MSSIRGKLGSRDGPGDEQPSEIVFPKSWVSSLLWSKGPQLSGDSQRHLWGGLSWIWDDHPRGVLWKAWVNIIHIYWVSSLNTMKASSSHPQPYKEFPGCWHCQQGIPVPDGGVRMPSLHAQVDWRGAALVLRWPSVDSKGGRRSRGWTGCGGWFWSLNVSC